MIANKRKIAYNTWGEALLRQVLMEQGWYLVEKKKIVRNCMVERIVVSGKDRKTLELYGLLVKDNGKFSDIRLLDLVDIKHRDKIKLKSWVRQTMLLDIYCKKGCYFSRKIVPVLSLTMIYNEATDMWDRL